MTRRQFFRTSAALALAGGCGRTTGGSGSGWLAWGRPGRHRGGAFERPRAIAATEDEVYVIDTTGRVQVFSHDGEFLRDWSLPESEKGTPTAIRKIDDSRVLIPHTHYSCILEWSPEGELLHEWGSYGSGENEFIYPTSVVLGQDGAYYISEYGEDAERVHVFDADRKFLRQWGSHGIEEGRFSRAMALDVDASGTVFVCDTANHRIQCFSNQGKFLRVIGSAGAEPGQLKFPYDLATAPDGTLVACEYGNNRISRFAPDGRFIACFGGPGRGPGEFNAPRGAAVSPNGLLFVADTDNHRVQRFPLEVLA